MANETVSVTLSANVEKYISDIKRAGAATNSQTALMGASFNFVKGAAIGMASAFSVGMFANFVSQTISSIDALNDLKDATGASIENLSAIEDIAVRTGTSFDTASTMLIKFNGVLKDAKPGSDAEAALKALNLDVKELRQLDPAEALLKAAVAMDKFAADGHMGRLQLELFGKATRQGAALLKDLAEKGELVPKVLTKQAQEAERFNNELNVMKKNAEDVTRTLTSKLVPVLNQLFVDFRTFTGQMSLASAAGDVVRLKKELDGLNENKNGIFNAFGGVDKQIAKVTEELTKAKAVFNALDVNRPISADGQKTNDRAAEFLKRQGAFDKPSVGVLPGKTEKTIDPLIKALAAYNDLTAKASGLSADFAEKWDALSLVYQRGKISVERLTDAQAELLRQQPFEKNQLEAAKKSAEARQELRIKEYTEIEAFQRDVVNAEDKFWRDILAATPTAKLEEQRKTIAKITESFSAGRYGDPGSYEAVKTYGEVINTYLDNTPEKIEKIKTMAEELGLSFTSAFEDAIVGGKGFSETLRGLEQDILRIVTRKMVTEPLGNAISGAVGGMDFGSMVSKLFTFDGGGYTGGGARAGGVDGKGGFMAVLHPQETVIDHARGQGARAGSTVKNNSVTVVVNQSFAPGTTRATTLQAAADASRQLQAAGRNL